MKKILIIEGNPKPNSLCGELAKVYLEAASKSNFEVKLIDLKDLKFDLNLYVGYKEDQKLEPDLLAAQQAIIDANHLVFIFPNWWSMMPALLKGFLDRVLLP